MIGRLRCVFRCLRYYISFSCFWFHQCYNNYFSFFHNLPYSVYVDLILTNIPFRLKDFLSSNHLFSIFVFFLILVFHFRSILFYFFGFIGHQARCTYLGNLYPLASNALQNNVFSVLVNKLLPLLRRPPPWVVVLASLPRQNHQSRPLCPSRPAWNNSKGFESHEIIQGWDHPEKSQSNVERLSPNTMIVAAHGWQTSVITASCSKDRTSSLKWWTGVSSQAATIYINKKIPK